MDERVRYLLKLVTRRLVLNPASISGNYRSGKSIANKHEMFRLLVLTIFGGGSRNLSSNNLKSSQSRAQP